MLCPKCGSYVMDGARSCPVCGAAISTGPQPHIQGGSQQNGYQQNGWQQGGYQQNGYQQGGYQQNGWQQGGYQQGGYQQNGYQQNGWQQNGYQQNGFQGGYTQPGFQYGRNRPYAANMPMAWFKFLIYFALWAGGVMNILSALSFFSGGSFLSILQGFAFLLVGAFDIFTRYRLAEFRRDGPVCLYICYGAPSAISLVFSLLYAMIYRYRFAVGSSLVSLVVSGVIIALNYVYFSKRAHLFRN